MTILVTGANGFIGRHVAEAAAARGHVVRLLLRNAPPSPPVVAGRNADYVVHDITKRFTDARTLAGVDAVVHCAALLGGDLEAQKRVTVTGTLHVLQAMKAAGIGHIVNISTFALYDYRAMQDHSELDEDAPLDEGFDRRAPYVRAKREQEDLVRERARSEGWRVTTMRPGLVYGADRLWFHHLGLDLGRTWVSLAGASLLPLTYVENCADAIVRAVESREANGSTINVVDDGPPTRTQYMRALAARRSPPPAIVNIPWSLLKAGAGLTTGVNERLLLGRAPLPDLLRSSALHSRCKPLTYSNARAKRLLGWTPRWTLEEALKRS